MSTSNPTPLRIGMKATFEGIACQLVGRIVKGVEEEGEIYCWHEFVLTTPDEKVAFCLEFEEEDGEIEWLLMFPFTPSQPLTTHEASQLKEGSTIALDQPDIEVTLIHQARVYLLEGEMPFAIEKGEVIDYFDAEKGQTRYAVEWTDHEIEFYRGMEISTDAVAKAFNLQDQPGGFQIASHGGAGEWTKVGPKGCALISIIATIIFAIVYFANYNTTGSGSSGTNSARRGFWGGGK